MNERDHEGMRRAVEDMKIETVTKAGAIQLRLCHRGRYLRRDPYEPKLIVAADQAIDGWSVLRCLISDNPGDNAEVARVCR